jgi:hypothetical protein
MDQLKYGHLHGLDESLGNLKKNAKICTETKEIAVQRDHLLSIIKASMH